MSLAAGAPPPAVEATTPGIPRSLWICSGEVGQRDYSAAGSADVLRAVLTDWMTNPKIKDAAYEYLTDSADPSGKGPKPRLRRLLLDERYVPQGFTLKLPGIRVERVDHSRRSLRVGELSIGIECFVPKVDGSFDVGFLHAGYGIIGGAYVSYSAKKVGGKWVVEYVNGFDP